MQEVSDLLDAAERRIRKSKHVDLWRASDARTNAEEILEFVLGRRVTSSVLDEELNGAVEKRFVKAIDRRVAGEPVASIVGFTEFYKMRLSVTPGVFIPRNSSEFLAKKAIEKIRNRARPIVVDVATGIGPVATAVAKSVAKGQVYGLDIAERSLRVGRSNASKLGLRNVKFLRSDMLSALPRVHRGKVDVFTIHPPYVARSAVRALSSEIRKFEPHVSLSDGSADGLGLVRLVAAEAPDWLVPGGWLLVEVSPDLSRKVAVILRAEGFQSVRSLKDSLGATRVIEGRTAKN